MVKQKQTAVRRHGAGFLAGCFFLLLSVFLHLLLLLLFHEPELEQNKTSSNTQRADYFLTPDDSAFAYVQKSIRAMQDPADFIRGGTDTGYSLFLANRRDQIRVDLPQIVYPVLTEQQNGTESVILPVKQVRESADLFSYPEFLASTLPVRPAELPAENHYPLWMDATGKILTGIDESEENKSALFQSHDVTGPTELTVIFDPELPPAVRIIRSSGSVMLDIYAQRQLQDRLLGDRLGLDPVYNNFVRIFWQKEKTGIGKEEKI